MELSFRPVGVDGCRQRVSQRLRPRPVGRSAAARPAAAPEDPRAATFRGARELVGEPGLAGARVADDDEEPATAGERIVEAGFEQSELLRASFEWRRGRSARTLYGLRPARADVERRNLREDRVLELPQRTSRLDPELRQERSPCGSVRVERFGLPAGAVEREHELAA